MDKLEKSLRKLASREREWIKDILLKLQSGITEGLNVRKLKSRNDIFRVRKGDIRIIYRIDKNGGIFVLTIERRKEDTYK